MGCIGSKKQKDPIQPTSQKKNEEPGTPNGARNTNTSAELNTTAPKNKIFETAIEIPIDNVYDLGDERGRGGFSIVYEATHRKEGNKVAIKVIEKSMLQDDIKLLKREIDIMKKVSHNNILKLFEIYESETRVCIVMELVDGSELFDRIVDKGYYSEKNAINIVKQILSAVAYLHQRGIAHRDLKPENLLCTGEGTTEMVKIADFGLSKIFSEEALMTSCGTPGYVAPEVLMSEHYDKSVDLWGVGIITYILLAGYPPFYAENDTALFEKIMNVEYDFDDDCWDEVSDQAKDFIRKLLVKDPEERYTAEQALKHAWLDSDPGDKELPIRNRMEDYNTKRKEEKKPRADNPDETVDALNAARKKFGN